MKKVHLYSQRGQSMAIAAVAMVALLVFAAFAVDLGFLFFQRRTTQNAADAASLAAARRIGLAFSTPGGGTVSLDDIQGTIDDFVARNAGQQASFVYVLRDGTRQDADGTTYVPSDTVGMEVRASNTFESWFARVLGYGQLGTSADACAAFAAAREIKEVAPIAVHQAYKVASGSATVNLSAASPGEIGALALSCSDPSTGCVPSTSDLVAWTKDAYPGVVSVPGDVGGRLDISCWGEVSLEPGRVLILPVYDVLEHHQYTDCEGDPSLAGCMADPETVDTVYDVVRDGVAVPYYSFHLRSFSAFQIGAAGWPNGRFISHAVNGAGGNEVNSGAIVVKLNCLEEADLSGTPPPTSVKTCEGVDRYEVTYTDFTEDREDDTVIYEFAVQSPCSLAISHIEFYFAKEVTVLNAFYRSYDPDTGFLGEPIVSDYEVHLIEGVTMVKFDDGFGDGEYRVLSIEVAAVPADGTPMARCDYPETVYIKAARDCDSYSVTYRVDGYDSGCP